MAIAESLRAPRFGRGSVGFRVLQLRDGPAGVLADDGVVCGGEVFQSGQGRGVAVDHLRAREIAAQEIGQLGVALDLMSAATREAPWAGDFGSTAAGRWLARHAWEFGWLMSYPEGQTKRTCYGFEPWHFRYVGRAAAARVHAAQVPLRVWLWRTSEGIR